MEAACRAASTGQIHSAAHLDDLSHAALVGMPQPLNPTACASTLRGEGRGKGAAEVVVRPGTPAAPADTCTNWRLQPPNRASCKWMLQLAD